MAIAWIFEGDDVTELDSITWDHPPKAEEYSPGTCLYWAEGYWYICRSGSVYNAGPFWLWDVTGDLIPPKYRAMALLVL